MVINYAISPHEFIEQHVTPLFYRRTYPAAGSHEQFNTEEDFWKKSTSIIFASVCLNKFRLSNWFPRAPGVYWSKYGEKSREQVWPSYSTDDPELGRIYNPFSKMSLIEHGGIGTIRLRPRRIDNTNCWLATAVKGLQCAGGIPLAIPDSFLREAKVTWGDAATIYGQVRFLQDAGLDDTAAYVHHASPIIIFVEKIEALPRHKQPTTPIILTPVSLFDHSSNDAQTKPRRWSRNEFGYTFVQCVDGSDNTINNAASWIERYARKYNGRIITNFDEFCPILADAPLSYQRLIKKDYDRTRIEHLHFKGAKLADRIDRVGEVVTTVIEGTTMSSDTYNIHGQIGAAGPHSHAHDMTFQQVWKQSSLDLPKLAEELGQLQTAMREQAKDQPDLDKAVSTVAAAQKAAVQGDEPAVLRHLKAAGKWTFDIAEKIGVAVAAEAIKRAM